MELLRKMDGENVWWDGGLAVRGRRLWLDLVTCLVRGGTGEEYGDLIHQQRCTSGGCAGIPEGS